jgi:hypothetical protein
MRRYTFLFIITLILSFAACKKDKQVAANEISAKKGTINWNTSNLSTGFKPLDTKDTLFIVAQNGEEDLVLAIKQKGAATYRPDEFKAYYYTTVGLDAVASKYHLINDPANTITITNYDETTHVVNVTFNLTLINNNSSISDKITFTNGKINAQLSDVFIDPFK